MPEATQSYHCGKCGAPVSGEVAGGFCTACLLEEGLAPAELAQNPITVRYFGDYELIEEIARGGMGVVFKARQRSLNRIVAVKMILSGHLASEAQAQRFRAEARAAAALQRPGIVAIHEVGEHEGLLFFSMDYIAGQSLAQLVRDGPWPAARAAQCVREIAEAIQYAHEQGVLHRDLKPSNVLIDANGKPHVTDFGLAKQLNAEAQASTEDPHLTLSGQVLGSPNFMPPEQAAGKHRELTASSDVYSLGAILYHCLTGRPPFVAETLTQTLRMVAEQEPVSPRLLNAGVPRDLETICLKCLEKDPSRRYATAQALANDLNRFLCHEPIHARPVSLVLKAHRWCLRNKLLAVTGTAVLVLLLVVAVGSPIAAVRISRERKQAETNQKKAQQESAKSHQVAKFLQDMLAGIEPDFTRGRDTSLLREILEKSLRQIAVEFTNHAEVQAQLETTIGIVYAGLGEPQKAEQLHARALATWRSLYGKQHPAVAESLYWLAAIHWERGQAEEAERLIREALVIRRKALGNENEDVAHTLNLLTLVLVDQAKWLEAERAAREGLAIKLKLSGREHLNVVKSLNMLGHVLASQGKYREAEKTAREALELYRAISANEVFPLTHLLSCLGQAICGQGRFGEAEAIFREMLEVQRKYFGNDHPDTAGGMSALAQTLRHQGDFAAAEALFRESLAVRERKLPDAWQTFHIRAQLGEVLLRQRKHGEAEQLLLTGFEGMKQRADQVRDRSKVFPEIIRQLIQLYEATGQSDKVGEWKLKLAELGD